MTTVLFAVFGAAALIGGVLGLVETVRVRNGRRVDAEVVEVGVRPGAVGGSPQAGATPPVPLVTVAWTDHRGSHTASLAAPGRLRVGDHLSVTLVGSRPAYARTRPPYGRALLLLAGGVVMVLLAFAV